MTHRDNIRQQYNSRVQSLRKPSLLPDNQGPNGTASPVKDSTRTKKPGQRGGNLNDAPRVAQIKADLAAPWHGASSEDPCVRPPGSGSHGGSRPTSRANADAIDDSDELKQLLQQYDELSFKTKKDRMDWLRREQQKNGTLPAQDPVNSASASSRRPSVPGATAQTLTIVTSAARKEMALHEQPVTSPVSVTAARAQGRADPPAPQTLGDTSLTKTVDPRKRKWPHDHHQHSKEPPISSGATGRNQISSPRGVTANCLHQSADTPNRHTQAPVWARRKIPNLTVDTSDSVNAVHNAETAIQNATIHSPPRAVPAATWSAAQASAPIPPWARQSAASGGSVPLAAIPTSAAAPTSPAAVAPMIAQTENRRQSNAGPTTPGHVDASRDPRRKKSAAETANAYARRW